MEKKLSAVASRRLVRAVRGHVGRSHAESEGTATFVRRDSDGTCWVRMPGASHDTPANGGILASAEPGQKVSYRIEGTRLTVTGNASDPAVGSDSMTKAIKESSGSLSELFGEELAKLLRGISADIISIINNAASGGTIDVSKLNLASYYTSAQVNSRITSEISSAVTAAFNLASASSWISQSVAYIRSHVMEPAISSAVSAVDVGGANLLDNTGWSSASDVRMSTTYTHGWWKQNGTSLSYSSGLVTIDTTANDSRGCVQLVEVEPSTKYVLSADVGDSYQIGIGSDEYPTDDGGWIADGKRAWKSFTTGSSQTTVRVNAYASPGVPCTINHLKLEKATVPSDWSPSAWDVQDEVGSAARTATDYLQSSNGETTLNHDDKLTLIADNQGVWVREGGGTPMRISGCTAKTALPLKTANVVAYGTGTDWTPYYERRGETIVVSGAVSPKSTVAASGSLTIAQLPTGHRPVQRVAQLCQGSVNAVWLLEIGTDGTMTASRYQTGGTREAMGTSTWLPFHVVFPTA